MIAMVFNLKRVQAIKVDCFWDLYFSNWTGKLNYYPYLYVRNHNYAKRQVAFSQSKTGAVFDRKLPASALRVFALLYWKLIFWSFGRFFSFLFSSLEFWKLTKILPMFFCLIDLEVYDETEFIDLTV